MNDNDNLEEEEEIERQQRLRNRAHAVFGIPFRDELGFGHNVRDLDTLIENINALPNALKNRVWRLMRHTRPEDYGDVYDQEVAKEIWKHEKELLKIQTQKLKEEFIRNLVARGEVIDRNGYVGPNALVMDVHFDTSGATGTRRPAQNPLVPEVDEDETDDEIEENRNREEDMEAIEAFINAPPGRMRRGNMMNAMLMINNLMDDIIVPRREPKREPESETLYLPRDDYKNWRHWKERHVMRWANKFIPDQSQLEIIHARNFTGRSLYDFLESDFEWKEVEMPFGIFVQLKTHLNRVINAFHEHQFSRRF
ncbi:unnamed protein product [Caenorhabditis brenneri]